MAQEEKYGTLIAPNAIRFERILPGPIERVWAYLTEPEKRAKWLASGDMEMRMGGAMELHWLHKNMDVAPEETPEKYANGHSMKATITRFDPPNALGFTWGARADALSEVVFELSMRGNEVLLVLTHQGLPNHKDLLSISGGWHVHLDVLMEHLNGRTSSGFWSANEMLGKEYRERLGTGEEAGS